MAEVVTRRGISFSFKQFKVTEYVKKKWRYERAMNKAFEAKKKKYMDEFMNEIEKTQAEASDEITVPQAEASVEITVSQAEASDETMEPQAGASETFSDKYSLEIISASDLRLAVVSIALFNGKQMVYECSGVAVRHWHGNIPDIHRIFVTSARLAHKFNDNRTRDDNLRIEVRTHRNVIMHGFLGLHDKHIAMVTSLTPHSLYTMDTSPVDLPKGTRSNKLLAVGLNNGTLMGASCSHPVFRDGLVSVNCNITETGLGGPVIRFGRCGSDHIAGIITEYCKGKGKATILPTKMLHEWLQRLLLITSKTSHFRGFSLPPGVKTVIPSGFAVRSKIHQSLGYPLPPPLVFELNGRLIGRFEELFGQYHYWDGYPFDIPYCYSGEKLIWEQFGEVVAKKISESVVSIASFYGGGAGERKIRYFACTGLLIGVGDCKLILTSASLVRNAEGAIDTSLSIEVFLPPKESANGMLELYHENYNIAIVRLCGDLANSSPQDIRGSPKDIFCGRASKKPVVAIGRAPKIADGLLMASMGEVKGKYNAVTKRKNNHLTGPHHRLDLDCKDLVLSTCQIKKVGIGGPLMRLDGSFIGMNFYDESPTTPFLPKVKIIEVVDQWSAIDGTRGLVSSPVNMELYLITQKRHRNKRPVNMEDMEDMEEEDYLITQKRQRNKWPVSEPYWCLSGQGDDV